MSVSPSAADVPLPERIAPEQLQELDPEGLAAAEAALREAERAVLTAMAPYDRALREVRSRLAELATEARRRERAEQVSRRATVRELARSGGMPSLAALLSAADSAFESATPLSEVRTFLSTGGEVRFGFATRAGVLAFTDGRRQQQARTWGDARALVDAGWEAGSPGVAGVRVHLPGSRVERVVPADELVVEVSSTR